MPERIDRQYSGIIFLTAERQVVLQRRDNKPGIVNPGMLTAFGGTGESDETPVETAMREAHEELDIEIHADELQNLCELPKRENDGSLTLCTFFVYSKPIDVTEINVREGVGAAIVALSEIEDENLISVTAKKAILELRRSPAGKFSN
ncbi:NUDIX domain-containing protein [Pseudofrankia asymbiotica]|uniref:NUDIX domain-containing protein n=1 Tax=Pseudofrankia asymbiotica TaxID=1834516 RepID=UPI00097612FD|nr:NUDIX domain-containing protein [Pseudofrankia asymbiotica]